MGKAGRWIKNFLGGKKDKDKERSSTANKNIPRGVDSPATTPVLTTPTTTAKEKRRWSFRRSSAAAATATVQKEPTTDITAAASPPEAGTDHEQEKPEMAAADGGGSVSSISVTKLEVSAANSRRGSAIEEFAAVKIQSVFRAYLARKALNALRGLVKLQALVRGHLVRKQATATLRCMQALVTVQARARAQRIKISNEESFLQNHLWQLEHTKSYHDLEENIKTVEMDFGEYKGNTRSRNSYSNSKPSVTERPEQHRYSTYSAPPRPQSRQDRKDVSPAPSALTEMSPRASSNHFEDYATVTAQSTPHYYSAMSKIDQSNFPFAYPVEESPEKGSVEYAESLNFDYTMCPSYMANTQSSRAKARSQSAPKSRPETFERQPSRRRASIEGRNVPRAVRMQRSSSQVGATAQNYNYPWSVRLDKSSASLKDSECGSTSTVLTGTQYCRSLVGFDVRGGRY